MGVFLGQNLCDIGPQIKKNRKDESPQARQTEKDLPRKMCLIVSIAVDHVFRQYVLKAKKVLYKSKQKIGKVLKNKWLVPWACLL